MVCIMYFVVKFYVSFYTVLIKFYASFYTILIVWWFLHEMFIKSVLVRECY